MIVIGIVFLVCVNFFVWWMDFSFSEILKYWWDG